MIRGLVLQGYYPERLAKLYFLNAPFIFGAVWKVVSPFIDSRTRRKVGAKSRQKPGEFCRLIRFTLDVRRRVSR